MITQIENPGQLTAGQGLRILNNRDSTINKYTHKSELCQPVFTPLLLDLSGGK
jgi:hypothetical protein